MQSYARPGGNLTGMTYLALDLVGRRIELLKDWIPDIRRLAILARPQHPGQHRERQATEDAVGKLGLTFSYFPLPHRTRAQMPTSPRDWSPVVRSEAGSMQSSHVATGRLDILFANSQFRNMLEWEDPDCTIR